MTGAGPHSRPLQGLALGLSISESEDCEGLGFTTREVNRTVCEISRAVLAQGGRVVFGHDWREGGVMETVAGFAVDYLSDAGSRESAGAPITNFVAWPDRSALSPEDRKRYHGVLEIIEAGRPKMPAGAALPAGEAANTVLRVLALTEMRRQMVALCDARLCIGGRTSGYQGRGAGVFEEAALTLEAGKPLYVTGLFGGASGEIVRALSGKPLAAPGVLKPPAELARALSIAGLEPDAGHYDSVLRNDSPDVFPGATGLTMKEHHHLFAAQSLTEVIGLVLRGMARLRKL